MTNQGTPEGALMAEAEGFEPSRGLKTPNPLSRRAP